MVEVELEGMGSDRLIVELGGGVRLEVSHQKQLELAAGLIHQLRAKASC